MEPNVTYTYQGEPVQVEFVEAGRLELARIINQLNPTAPAQYVFAEDLEVR